MEAVGQFSGVTVALDLRANILNSHKRIFFLMVYEKCCFDFGLYAFP